MIRRIRDSVVRAILRAVAAVLLLLVCVSAVWWAEAQLAARSLVSPPVCVSVFDHPDAAPFRTFLEQTRYRLRYSDDTGVRVTVNGKC